MPDPTVRAQADRRFEAALAATGARDPREHYRAQLRSLREKDARVFEEAVRYFDGVLIPRVAAADSDPLAEWLDFGRRLAEWSAPGRTTQIDPSGRAHAYSPPVPLDHLVLHLPVAAREAAHPIGLPAALSPAQRATYDLLVRGRLSLGEP
jgi:hypothetical protein